MLCRRQPGARPGKRAMKVIGEGSGVGQVSVNATCTHAAAPSGRICLLSCYDEQHALFFPSPLALLLPPPLAPICCSSTITAPACRPPPPLALFCPLSDPLNFHLPLPTLPLPALPSHLLPRPPPHLAFRGTVLSNCVKSRPISPLQLACSPIALNTSFMRISYGLQSRLSTARAQGMRNKGRRRGARGARGARGEGEVRGRGKG